MKKILYCCILTIYGLMSCSGQSTACTTADSLTAERTFTLSRTGAIRAIQVYKSERYLSQIVVKQDSLIGLLKLQNTFSEAQNRACEESIRFKGQTIGQVSLSNKLRGVENNIWRVAAITIGTAFLISRL